MLLQGSVLFPYIGAFKMSQIWFNKCPMWSPATNLPTHICLILILMYIWFISLSSLIYPMCRNYFSIPFTILFTASHFRPQHSCNSTFRILLICLISNVYLCSDCISTVIISAFMLCLLYPTPSNLNQRWDNGAPFWYYLCFNISLKHVDF